MITLTWNGYRATCADEATAAEIVRLCELRELVLRIIAETGELEDAAGMIELTIPKREHPIRTDLGPNGYYLPRPPQFSPETQEALKRAQERIARALDRARDPG